LSSDPVFKNHGSQLDPKFLAELVDMEDEGKACPVRAAEQLLEERRFEKVMRMTPQAFGRLSPVEKRNFTRWAKHLARVFSEKAAVFERNSTPEPEAPAYLQARL
jgi:hypothetical protein